MQQNLFDSKQNLFIPNILPKDGIVEAYPAFFDAAESDDLFAALLKQINWQQSSMKLYGKAVLLPRLTAWYGDARQQYSYSGIHMNSELWTSDLLYIKEKIEKQSGIKFTSVLLNRYRNGNDSVSWHRDNEKLLGINPVIASVSFGATRIFKFRHIDDHKLIRELPLTPGMFLLMKG